MLPQEYSDRVSRKPVSTASVSQARNTSGVSVMAPTDLDRSTRTLLAELNSAVNGPDGLDEPHKVSAIQTARELTDALEIPRIAIDMHWRMVRPIDHPFLLLSHHRARFPRFPKIHRLTQLCLAHYTFLQQGRPRPRCFRRTHAKPALPKTATELATECHYS